jgi:sec-independent protein translocase protein TatC
MADTPKDDELAGTEQPFVQHLMELRDRLIKAMVAMASWPRRWWLTCPRARR